MKNASPTRILAMVTVLHGATHLYTTFLPPMNRELKAYFGLTLDQDVTRLMTVYLIFYALANLMAGLVVNWFQPRTLLSIGPLANGICVAAIYWLTPADYTWLCVLIGAGAVGGGLYHPVANMLLTKTFPENKGRALGIAGVGACVTFIAGPWIASVLVSRQLCSWQQVCLAYGMAGIISGVAAWILVPRDESFAPGRSIAASILGEAGKARSELGPVLMFAVFLTIVMAGREMASWGTTSITQQFVLQAYAEPIDPGFLIAAIFAPGLIVQPLAGKWSDQFGRERVLAVAMLGMTLALLLIPVSPRPLIVVAYALLGAAMTASVPTIEALLADRAPVYLRGLVYGLVITAGIGIGAFGPKLVGLVADAGHRTFEAYRNGYWALAGLSFVSFLLALALRPAARVLRVNSF
jgi:MFS family permease